jgi:Predicted transcriptional regulators
MTITQAGEQFKIAPEKLKYYEEQGLFDCRRTPDGAVEYTEGLLEDVGLIGILLEAGAPVSALREYLSRAARNGVSREEKLRFLRAQRGRLLESIHARQKSLDQLDYIIFETSRAKEPPGLKTRTDSPIKANEANREEYKMSEKKILVAYFSASGVTAKAAKLLAEAADADLFEIRPAQPYTGADLNWSDPNSRSSVEMGNPASRPAVENRVDGMDRYEAVFVGFPIWWGVAPTIINTFLESYDFTGKTVVPFATSGGSGMGSTAKRLRGSVSAGTKLEEGKLLSGRLSAESLRAWAEKYIRQHRTIRG